MIYAVSIYKLTLKYAPNWRYIALVRLLTVGGKFGHYLQAENINDRPPATTVKIADGEIKSRTVANRATIAESRAET